MAARPPCCTPPDTAGADADGPERTWAVQLSLARVAFRGGTADGAVQARVSSRAGWA